MKSAGFLTGRGGWGCLCSA